MRKPDSINGVSLLSPPRAPARPIVRARVRPEDHALEYLARLGKVTVEPVEGGYRVTTAAGKVCGPTLEEALIGAVMKAMDVD